MKRTFMSLGAIALLSNSVEARLGKAADTGAAGDSAGEAAQGAAAAAGGPEDSADLKKTKVDIQKATEQKDSDFGKYLHDLYNAAMTGVDKIDDAKAKDICAGLLGGEKAKDHFKEGEHDKVKECTEKEVKDIVRIVNDEIKKRKDLSKKVEEANTKYAAAADDAAKKKVEKDVQKANLALAKNQLAFLQSQIKKGEAIKKQHQKEKDLNKVRSQLASSMGTSSSGSGFLGLSMMAWVAIIIGLAVVLIAVFMLCCRGSKRSSGAYESYDDESTAIASGMRVNGNSSYQSTSNA